MKDSKPAIRLLIIFTFLCGGLYPAVVTVLAQAVFPRQAAGSLLADAGGRLLGSALIGQNFVERRYFWPRPSATSPFPYNPLASGGSNLGPTNPVLFEQVEERIQTLRGHGAARPFPADLVLASASGLDPHISPASAMLQLSRVAQARGLEVKKLARLVDAQVEGRELGFLGEPRVNVLRLNLALDSLAAP